MRKAIGVFFGTEYSAMAYIAPTGEPKIIKNVEGGNTTQSVVSWKRTEKGDIELLVGKVAKEQAVLNPEDTVKSIKRKIGTDYKKEIYGEEYTPEEISSRILMKLKADAEMYLGEEITDVVISVPAYFRALEREATKTAARLAGWDIEKVKIVNEPVAAALTFGLDKDLKEGKIFIFDLGGGTFDTTVFDVVPDIDGRIFNVVTTGGKRLLGGDDFDARIINYVAEEFKKENSDYGGGLRDDPGALQRLTTAAEEAKKELSSAKSTKINIPFIIPEKSLHVDMKLTREKFNELTEDLIEEIKELTEKTLVDAGAGIKKEEIDKVVMVGGCSRIPAVIDAVREVFPDKDVLLHDPDEAIAKGAAIFLTHPPVTDLLSHSLGVEAIVNGMSGKFVKIIKKNTMLPTKSSEAFATPEDNVTSVVVKVYEGENETAKDNFYWGELVVQDIPAAPKGQEKVDVTFEYSTEGLLAVTATVESTGKPTKTEIENPARISDKELPKMKARAEEEAKALMPEGDLEE